MALDLQHTLDWDDLASEQVTSHQDDEYRWAGVEDPKVVVTTSRDPSSRLKMFAKVRIFIFFSLFPKIELFPQEFKLIIPNSQRINRGNYQIKQLIESCRANSVTDFVVLHETRGEPDGLVVCHLPFGPTAYFQMLNTVMRHDIPNVGTMSEAYPHLVIHNMDTKLGIRVSNILKYLFPVPKEESKRVITFANQNDYISFRHHVYKTVEGGKVEIAEVGPRFELRLYQIKLGTLEVENAIDTEWAFKPYMNTTKKRAFLSSKIEDEDDQTGGKPFTR